MAQLRLLVGLGNPGQRYIKTRHNVGFWFLDDWLAQLGSVSWRSESRFQADFAEVKIAGQSVIFLKPQTFMNLSGQAVGKVLRYFKISPQEMLVVHDELDFEAGVIRFKDGGGHGGHNGLRDIVATLGDGQFHRMRIGIGHPGDRRKVSDYVLSAVPMSDTVSIELGFERVHLNSELLVQMRFDQLKNKIHQAF
ncbi:MAG: aminoacyl-tRNA hydrolase [Methylococcales bacterium]|nr:aminoacyl-tRNA hydrolase [Methylococcales bacterium]MBT7968150.1 aminoacyl-tRNA hydrolase [Methylococcales bacterium]